MSIQAAEKQILAAQPSIQAAEEQILAAQPSIQAAEEQILAAQLSIQAAEKQIHPAQPSIQAAQKQNLPAQVIPLLGINILLVAHITSKKKNVFPQVGARFHFMRSKSLEVIRCM
ncbi:hypothetical protein ACQKNB_20750 [Lysinibacillus xylanilyticus]|uniref:hypothetical protein n=1 Tax=Lysinibacillus xylanilyticus TaxID=582475 RepID=UPI003CFFB1F5